ncbi:hypothetical protein chiPu_0028306, partial [Chiloscyllium punctatum]|nr:hypothetical protein [Chiloscyllium punctatum]
PGSFQLKKFCKTSGLAKKSVKEIEQIFAILDDNKSGFIEKSELRSFLQYFVPQARKLSDSEMDSFVSAGDADGDGKINLSGQCLNIYNNSLIVQFLTKRSLRRNY